MSSNALFQDEYVSRLHKAGMTLVHTMSAAIIAAEAEHAGARLGDGKDVISMRDRFEIAYEDFLNLICER